MMNYPVRYFQNNQVFDAIKSILPQNIPDYPDKYDKGREKTNMFDLFNWSLDYCRDIVGSSDDDLCNIYEDSYFWALQDSNNIDKWVAVATFILLNFEFDKTGNSNIGAYLDYVTKKADEIYSFDKYNSWLEKVRMHDGYKNNPTPCNFGNMVPLPASYGYTDEELFWITNGYDCYTIEHTILPCYNNYEGKKRMLLKINKAWRSVNRYTESSFSHPYKAVYPYNEFFYKKMMDVIIMEYNKGLIYEGKYLDVDFSQLKPSHYPDIKVEYFNNELLNQIQRKYDDGEQDVARHLWTKAYTKIKKYEPQIEVDYMNIRIYENINDIKSYNTDPDRFPWIDKHDSNLYAFMQNIINMNEICDKYHTIVEPYHNLFEVAPEFEDSNKEQERKRKSDKYPEEPDNLASLFDSGIISTDPTGSELAVLLAVCIMLGMRDNANRPAFIRWLSQVKPDIFKDKDKEDTKHKKYTKRLNDALNNKKVEKVKDQSGLKDMVRGWYKRSGEKEKYSTLATDIFLKLK